MGQSPPQTRLEMAQAQSTKSFESFYTCVILQSGKPRLGGAGCTRRNPLPGPGPVYQADVPRAACLAGPLPTCGHRASGATEPGELSATRAPPRPHPLHLGRALCPPAPGHPGVVTETRPLCPSKGPCPALVWPGLSTGEEGREGPSGSAQVPPIDPGAGAEPTSPSPSHGHPPHPWQCQREGHPGGTQGC